MNQLQELFPYLNEDDMVTLKSISKVKNLPKKEAIVKTGIYSPDFYFIKKGIIRGYYITEEGVEKTIFIGNEGLFGGAPESILKNKPTKYYFEAVTEVDLLIFNIHELEEVAKQYENIFKLYTAALKIIISTLLERVEELTSSTPEERFLNLHKTRPLVIDKALKKQIANFLGISPNSLSRIISRKESKNYS
jgi:CRP-like cAMP-binding protein